jgi:hypothetical protein
MRDWFAALVMGPDGKPDEQACISIAGAATFLGLEIYNVVHLHLPFDAQSFGIGFGAVMAATGAGLGLRARWGAKQ